jgi:hypothetical protein
MMLPGNAGSAVRPATRSEEASRMKTLATDRDKAEILRRLRSLRPDSVRRWGRMSPHQMVCHLSDSFRMATGARRVSPSRRLPGRPVLKWIVLYLPVPWPAGILTSAEIDQELGGTRPADFAADLTELQSLLEFVTTHKDSFTWQRHPIFGRMSESAWLRWAYLHTDHHLRQFGV